MDNKCHLFFETLGTKLKIGIIMQLKEKPLSVNELSKHLNQERSGVSHALKSLLECGFIKVRVDGRKRIYSLNTDTIMPLLGIVEKHIRKYCKICSKRK